MALLYACLVKMHEQDIWFMQLVWLPLLRNPVIKCKFDCGWCRGALEEFGDTTVVSLLQTSAASAVDIFTLPSERFQAVINATFDCLPTHAMYIGES